MMIKSTIIYCSKTLRMISLAAFRHLEKNLKVAVSVLVCYLNPYGVEIKLVLNKKMYIFHDV